MNKLRVGVILPNVKAPIWVRRMLERIQDSSDAEVVVLALTGETAIKDDFASQLYELHFQLDKRVFFPDPNPWEQKDILDVLPNVQLLDGKPGEQNSRLKAISPDVLLNLSLDEIPKPLLDIARYGVWSLRCNEGRVTMNTRFGWLELLRDEPLLHCVVEAQRGTSLETVAKSVTATDSRSFMHNQKSFLWRVASLLPRALKQLHSQGENEFFSQAESLNPARKILGPTPAQAIVLALKQIFIFSRKKILNLWLKDRWALMARVGSGGGTLNWDGFKPLLPPRSVFWADPFILERHGKSYIFFEELPYKTELGHISYVEVGQDGRITAPQIALEKPYHLSYPFLFEYRGGFYMIPETAHNRAIEMYRCARFPDQWEYYKTIMQDVSAVDATLIEHDGLWWMFVNLAGEGGLTLDELHLFYAEEPLSDQWTQHPMNPIVSDVRSARPAGRIFRRDGRLVRPSQDSSIRYGYALNLNHITKLTTNEYGEELIERLEPPKDGDILGVHTYNFSGDITVMDVMLKQ